MNYGIESVKDLVEFISYIITSLSLVGIGIAYALSKKQIHFSTMTKCINDYRELMKPRLKDKDLAEQYIDLVNEELFYFENNFVPIEVSIEWIDGMIDYLPFFKDGKFEKSKMLTILDNSEATKKMLHNYPRVMKVIKINNAINFEVIHQSISEEDNRKLRKAERDKLILQMISKLKIGFCTKQRFKCKIKKR